MSRLTVAEAIDADSSESLYNAKLAPTSLPGDLTDLDCHAAEPHYTNRTTSFSGCLDYIFHDEQWRVKKLLPLPQGAHLVFPNKLWPSDHLAIMAELEL
jgi:mRNA deadenylase 3'-5' endonuclease subunit Ccr4